MHIHCAPLKQHSVIVETLAHPESNGVEYDMQYTLPLCKKLQYIQTDLDRASQEAANLKTLIRCIKVDECIWEQLYTDAEQLARTFDIQLSKPRTTARQTQEPVCRLKRESYVCKEL